MAVTVVERFNCISRQVLPPSPPPPSPTDGALGQNLQFLNVELTDLFLEFLWGPSLPLELFCRPVLSLEAFTRHGLRHFFLSFSSTVLLLVFQIIRAAVALATLIGKNPNTISSIYPKHFLQHNDTNKAKQRQVQIYIIRPCLHSTTLYC